MNWEGALQLILDVIQTDGRPGEKPSGSVAQIPVLASNMDLQVRQGVTHVSHTCHTCDIVTLDHE